jgi:DNA helicase-2/ATP-dependent DNA helicase PcrA
MSVPAYVVFTDNTLIAIAETLPTDDAALVAIPGIGARKLEQYGPDVLALVKGRQSS